MDWLKQLQDAVLGGLPSAVVALCPDYLRKQWLERLADQNPFKTISANHDLVRATRLAWITAAQEVLEQAAACSTNAEWRGASAKISTFNSVIRDILLDARDDALDRRSHPDPSPIDAHVQAVIAGVPELVSPGEHAGIGATVTTGFTATLAELSGWGIQEIPAVYQQIAEQGLPTYGGGSRRTFGELVFAAFAEIIKDPRKHPEATVAFHVAMDKVGRDIGRATLDAVKGIDDRLDELILGCDALAVLREGLLRYIEFLPRIAEDTAALRAGFEEILRHTRQSASAPPQAVSADLKDGLRPYHEVSDAWLRLTEGQLPSEVPFIGRENEMARLLAFATGAEDRRPFTWQVLWGAHATGKSRLAREWLRVLCSSSPAWNGGFAAYSGAELLGLLSRTPSAPTAIVIDDAASYGESLWLFLQRAERWRSADKPVRVLLVAHEDLAPPAGGGFERAEAVRALRQVAPLDPARTAALFQAGRAHSTIAALPGIRLDPAEAAEGAAYLDAVTNTTRRPLSTAERDSILEETGGRPAFLILAAIDPVGWSHRIENYAQMIVKDAESLFSPGLDGLKILAASVLIGPFPDELRGGVAPGATPPDRLRRLFPGSSADLASEIPRFEPDTLGFHVCGSALSALSSSERRELLRSLHDANRDRFVAQVTAWFSALEPDYAYYCRLLAPTENQEKARLAAALDDLVSILAEHADHQVNGPSAQASYKRRDAILSILHIDSLPEAALAKVVREALRYLPHDGWGEILELGLAEHGLAHAESARWLALIEGMTSAFGPIVRENAPVATFSKRDPQLDEGAAAMTAALKSTAAFDRMEAAYELGLWLQKNPVEGRLAVKAHPGLLAGLTSCMDDSSDHVRTAAAWCFRQADLWAEPMEPNMEIERAIKIATASIRRWITTPEPTHTIEQFIQLYDFKVDCRIAGQERRWFDEISDLPQPPRHHLGSDELDLLRRIATEDYDTSRLDSRLVAWNAEKAANVLMRAGLYEAGAAAATERALLQGGFKERTLSALCRVAATDAAEAHAFLATVVGKMNYSDEIALFLCAFALLSGELEVIDVMRPIVERSTRPVDLDALLAVARMRTRGDAWRGEAVSALCKRLDEFRVRRSGHLVHKLKAKDSTGRWAYYFVLIQPENERAFMKLLGGAGMISLEDHGKVIASCYGQAPSPEIIAFLKEKYGFNIKP